MLEQQMVVRWAKVVSWVVKNKMVLLSLIWIRWLEMKVSHKKELSCMIVFRVNVS